jgi:predicted DNA repair protein MutK
MASGFLMLLDDVATILDDIAVMSKVAAKKSAGILGDDLALNAEQVTGVTADRELPVVWAVAKGSLINKLILIPLALLVSSFVPWLVTPLMMVGGVYLCFEGFEKVSHRFLVGPKVADKEKTELLEHLKNDKQDLVMLEKDKIKGAIRTDFILSAEIVVLTLGIVAGMSFWSRVGVLALIGVSMTLGVYGLVGALVKVDDLGLYLLNKSSALAQQFGGLLLKLAPLLMKVLSVAGTAAMFLVGGGIFSHGIPTLHHFKDLSVDPRGFPFNMLFDGTVGVVVGALALLSVVLVARIRKLFPQ